MEFPLSFARNRYGCVETLVIKKQSWRKYFHFYERNWIVKKISAFDENLEQTAYIFYMRTRNFCQIEARMLLILNFS